MTREEMIRILDFIDGTHSLSQKSTSLSATDPRWNIVSFAMRRHLEGKLLTVTSLASASGVPYGTAMRRFGDLIEQGHLIKRPRSKSGKSFSLHPTRQLIAEFETFAMQFRSCESAVRGAGCSNAGMSGSAGGGAR